MTKCPCRMSYPPIMYMKGSLDSSHLVLDTAHHALGSGPYTYPIET